jgi:alkylated DNA nucleotide flippase Atl1
MADQHGAVAAVDETRMLQMRLAADARLSSRLAAAYEEHARMLMSAVEAGAAPDEIQVRGKVQKRVVGVPEIFTERGMSAGEVARKLSYDEANAYTVLDALVKAGHVEHVPGVTPRRYRMRIKHRRDRILRLSRLVPHGRWTTYGDFAIAVYDNSKMAITIGRIASNSPAFVHPHRVIWSGGVVKDVWSDDHGRGRDECLRRLATEGVHFPDGEHADPACFIGWKELQALLEADEARDRLDETA